MNENKLNDSERVMVMIACLSEREEAFELFHFLPQTMESRLVEYTRELLMLPKKDFQHYMVKEFRKLREKEKVQLPAQLDLGWIQESLKQENPFVGIHLIRSLGQSKVKQILQGMPSAFLKRLSQFDSKVYLEPELLKILQKKFFAQFEFRVPSKDFSENSLQVLFHLKMDFLVDFLSQIGLERLAYAFKGLNKTALKALFNRLPLKDAKRLQSLVKSLEKVPSREISESQSLLLNLNLEAIEPENLFYEVGVAYVSKGFTREDKELLKAIQLRFPPKVGYLLKRYVEQSRVRENSAVRQRVLKYVEEKLKSLPSHAFH